VNGISPLSPQAARATVGETARNKKRRMWGNLCAPLRVVIRTAIERNRGIVVFMFVFCFRLLLPIAGITLAISLPSGPASGSRWFPTPIRPLGYTRLCSLRPPFPP